MKSMGISLVYYSFSYCLVINVFIHLANMYWAPTVLGAGDIIVGRTLSSWNIQLEEVANKYVNILTHTDEWHEENESVT